MKDTKHKSSEKARDGYFKDLPDDLQLKLLKAHKIIVDKVNSLLEDSKYRMINNSSQAMSAIESFMVGPSPKDDVGAVRAYCKGTDDYSCMIQFTGHFRNYQNDPIEEFLHDFINEVYTSSKSTLKKEYKFDLDSEGANGNSFEGFDVYPDKEAAKEIWELFEDHKTKVVKESSNEIEVTQDLLDYYEFYGNIPYDQYFLEKSNGKLKYDFRKAYDWKTGHGIKIIYSLDDIDVKNVGSGYIGSSEDKRKQTISDIQANIRQKGNADHLSSGQKILAIIDRETGEKLNSVEMIGPFAPGVHSINLSIMDIDGLHDYYNGKGKEFIDKYVKRITVGQIDNSQSFKSTHWFNNSESINKLKNGWEIKRDNTITRGNAAEALKYGRGAKMNDASPSGTVVIGRKPVYMHPSKKDIRDNPEAYKKESADYEFYENNSDDQYFLERSNGLLNFSFRLGYNVENGHRVKIVFDLKPDDVEIFGSHTKSSLPKKLAEPDQVVNPRTGRTGPNIGKAMAKIDDENRKNIKKVGDVDFASSGIVKAIVDLDTKEKLHSVNATGIYTRKAGQLESLDELDKIGKNRTFFPNNFADLSRIEREKIASSIGKNVTSIKYVVGEKESDITFKTTSGFTTSTDGLLTSAVAQSNIARNSLQINPDKKIPKKPRQIDQYLRNKSNKINESADTPEYNVDMSEGDAKKAIRAVSQGIINDFANKSKGKQITQYTLNIYANVISKNLLPKWTKGYRYIKITLDASSTGNSFEFIPPTMSQDFVSRFVAGRESLNGFLHRAPEIRMKISPSCFQTMKEADDAFNFFKSAIQYYDFKVEKYGTKLMTEVMKLGHNMKHLIGNSKLSGMVTYPLSMLFVFDHVNMSEKDTFSVKQEDIQTVNKFVRNIASRYAAPEKEKRQIVEDVKKMVTALRESCEYTDTIRNLVSFPESLEMLYSNGFDDVILESSKVFIESNIDNDWTRFCSDPKLKLLQEQFGVKKLKRIPTDLVAYISIETEAIKDANDKMMIASYCLGKLEIVEWYIELLEVGSKKYVVPHTKAYLEGVRTQLLACFKKIMDTPLPKQDRPIIDIRYPKGYEG